MRMVAFLAVLLLASAGPAHAQEPLSPDSAGGSVVQVTEKSTIAAGLLEWLVPTAGYAYAGNWVRGIPSALARVGGIALYLDDQFTIFGSPPPCEAKCVAGAALAVGGTIWGIVDASATASRENERRRAEATRRTVSLYPRVGRSGVGLGFRVVVP